MLDESRAQTPKETAAGGSQRALRNRERFRHRERDASCIYWHAAINGAHGVCRTTAFYAAILRGMFMNEGIDTRFARHAS